ncbi:hypothetical protein ACFU3J_16230 [Streptomyces sp. NPDC057411]|uniref:hypothetical protein n=1 Tax=unclassified Streptomyces TaxID=2593676 RepID=UPI003636BAC0
MSRRRTSRTAEDTPLQAAPDAQAGVAVGDQVAEAANRAASGYSLGPFAPTPLDPATVTGTPEEQLAMVSAAMRQAKAAYGTSAKAAKVRLTVELGAALDIAVTRDLYKAGGYTSVEAYAEAEVDLNRAYVYELIADSKRIRAVMAARLSEFSDSPPLASHAKVLAPVLAQENGTTKAREVIAAITASGKKLTAAALTAQVKRLGYDRPTVPGQGRAAETETAATNAALREEASRKLTAAADAAERALALYETALADGVAPADTARAAADLARLTKAGRILAKQTRLPADSQAPAVPAPRP